MEKWESNFKTRRLIKTNDSYIFNKYDLNPCDRQCTWHYSKTCDVRVSKLHFLRTKLYFNINIEMYLRRGDTLKCTCDEGTPVINVGKSQVLMYEYMCRAR